MLAWVSPPVNIAFTLSGTISYNFWVKTSSTTGAPKTVARVYRLSGGVETQVSTKTSALTQSTSIQADAFTDAAPTSTAFAIGDRIVVKVLNASTSATGTETMDYAGPTNAADGDSFISLTETVTFMREAEFIQKIEAANAASATSIAATMAGATAAGNLLVCYTSWSDVTHTVSIGDGGDTFNTDPNNASPTNWSTNTERYQAFYAANVSASTKTITATFSAAATGRYIEVLEYAGCNASAPFDTSAANATGTSATSTSGAITTSSPNTVVVVNTQSAGSGTVTAGTGFVIRSAIASNGEGAEDASFMAIQSGLTGSIGSLTPVAWVTSIMAFKWADPVNVIGDEESWISPAPNVVDNNSTVFS